MPDYLIYFILGGVVIIAIIATWILLKPKKIKVVELKTNIELILLALGGLNNIIDIKREHSRVKLMLAEPKKVDGKSLVEMKIPAILKSKELTLLLKDEPKAFVSKIETMKKEVE